MNVQQKSNERLTNKGQMLLQRWQAATLALLQLIVLQRWPPLRYNSQQSNDGNNAAQIFFFFYLVTSKPSPPVFLREIEKERKQKREKKGGEEIWNLLQDPESIGW